MPLRPTICSVMDGELHLKLFDAIEKYATFFVNLNNAEVDALLLDSSSEGRAYKILKQLPKRSNRL